MDSGAHLFLVGAKQEAKQRLRAAAGERRRVHLRSDESSDGKAFGSLMRLFGRSRKGNSANFVLTAFSEVRIFPVQDL